jgi:nicotinamide-nucleotide amidase
MTLRAEIISIGDELTSGQRLDTNSKWLSERLGEVGLKTVFHTTVGDDLKDNIDAFRNAARRADVVIATGGLGPTADDLTREAIAEAFNLPLELRSSALAHIEGLFAMRKRPMPERNRVQAMFPVGSQIIDNPHGTAPGIDLIVNREFCDSQGTSRIFSLPGVPAEMMQMTTATVLPRMFSDLGVGKERWYFHSIKLFGIGESDVEKRLPDLIARDRDPVVGITVSKATITLRIAALCASDHEFRTKIQPTVDQIHAELGLLIFGEGEIDIDIATNQLLLQRNLKLGLVEIGSGGWIHRLLAPLSEQEAAGLLYSTWFPSLQQLEIAAQSMNLPAEVQIVSTGGDESKSDINRSILSRVAEATLRSKDLDLVLVAGVYPTLREIQSSTTLPASDFSLALARRGRPVKHAFVTLGAHPDVLYHRLAKAGLNFLRMELLQNA